MVSWKSVYMGEGRVCMTESREELAAKIAKLEAGNKWAGEILIAAINKKEK